MTNKNTANKIPLDAFKFFKLSPAVRLILASVLYAGGILLQYFTASVFAGIPLFILAWPFLAVKTITNKPDDQGFEEWKPVSMKEVDRLYDNLQKSRDLKPLKAFKGGCFAVVFIFIGIMFFMFFIMDDIRINLNFSNGQMVFQLIADVVLMFIPLIFYGNLKVFVPRELEMKASSFYTLLSDLPPKGMVYTPYFRFDKDAKGRPIPEDMRIMLEMKRKPEDFMGVQFQIAINNGPNGAVPYMYAVVLTEGKEGSYRKVVSAIKKLSGLSADFEIEAGGDNKYGTIVIRQETSGGGYHTDSSDIKSLKSLVVEYLKVLA